MTTRVIGPAGSAPGEADGQGIDDALRLALTRAVFEQGAAALAIGFACLVLCAVLLRGAVPDAGLLTWLGIGLATVALRVPLVRRAGRVTDEALPYRANLVLVACSGCVWGSLALFWSPGLGVATHLVLILFPLTMSIGVVASYGARKALFFAFALPAQLPLLAAFLLAPDDAFNLLALPTALFVAGQAVIVRRFNRLVRETIALRLGNEALVADLSVRNDALATARDEAECASVAKSEFLARMSHEVRTPMNGVIGAAELLARTPLDGSQSTLLATLRGSALSLLGLLDALLDVSAAESGRLGLEPADYALRDVLERVVDEQRTVARSRSLSLELVVDAAVPTYVHGDGERLGQTVRRLVENAIRFTDVGGVRVHASLAGTDDAPPSRVERRRQRPGHRARTARGGVRAVPSGGRLEHPPRGRRRGRAHAGARGGGADGRRRCASRARPARAPRSSSRCRS